MTNLELVEKVGLPFDWDENEVWNFRGKKYGVTIEELAWHFFVPFWDGADGKYTVTPFDVLSNPDKYPEHWERINRSDLGWCIYVIRNPKTGLLTILDSIGRYSVAYMYLLKRNGASVMQQRQHIGVMEMTMEQMQATKGYRERGNDGNEGNKG